MAKKKAAKSGKIGRQKSSAKATKKKTSRAKMPAKKKRQAAPKPAKLPRPTISGEEKLFLLFKDDYHARQIFDFLRVETVRDLEEFGADDIVRRLSQPVVDSVERIRRRLAEKNRYLSNDEDYLRRSMDKAGEDRVSS
ncbi:MAG TPA: hypothetical protein PK867_20610 [Pirellulales bacterium]|nr:hypothetical protein [Pirellulales bacterium]